MLGKNVIKRKENINNGNQKQVEHHIWIAKSAYENGAELLFRYMGEYNKKIEELISKCKGALEASVRNLQITGKIY